VDLKDRQCVPCRGGVPPLRGEDLEALREQLGAGWEIIREHHLNKAYPFLDWEQAMAFVNRVSDLAEEQGHHPNVHLAWGKVRLEIWTHRIDGLTESDFILAAKADELL
jgi:4a-hydroxytetrahydrobiopterin dehydratase